MEKEAKRAREEDARILEKKSAQEREEEKKRDEIKQIAELHDGLQAKATKCREVLQKSRDLHKSGALTKNVKGLEEMREEIRKIFAESHKTLEDMQRQVEGEITKIVDDADHVLASRYEASQTLLEGAVDAASKASSMPLESQNVRMVVMKRLKDLQDQLSSVESLPSEPIEVSSLMTMQKQDSIDKLHLVRIQQSETGLFGASKPAGGEAKASSPEPMEDDETILKRIRAKLRKESSSSSRSRDNGRYANIRSSVGSGMSDDMKAQAIGSIIFERGPDVLGVDFDEVFAVSAAFLEMNSIDHIMSDLNSPADFNLELRAIHQFLKETHKL